MALRHEVFVVNEVNANRSRFLCQQSAVKQSVPRSTDNISSTAIGDCFREVRALCNPAERVRYLSQGYAYLEKDTARMQHL